MGTCGWAVLWQKARACPTAPAREQGRLGGGQGSSSPGHQAPPWGWDVSPRVGVGSVDPMAGPGRVLWWSRRLISMALLGHGTP